MPSIFITDNRFEADERVFITDNRFEGAVKVNIVDTRYNADKIVYVVDARYTADRIVYIVDTTYQADRYWEESELSETDSDSGFDTYEGSYYDDDSSDSGSSSGCGFGCIEIGIILVLLVIAAGGIWLAFFSKSSSNPYVYLASATPIQSKRNTQEVTTSLTPIVKQTLNSTVHSTSIFPTPRATVRPATSPKSTEVLYCPGALESKLEIGENAAVNYFQVSTRSNPGFNSSKEHVLADGRVVEIVDGPECADQTWWWKVYFSGTVSSGKHLEFNAWMPEVDYDTYYLEPVP